MRSLHNDIRAYPVRNLSSRPYATALNQWNRSTFGATSDHTVTTGGGPNADRPAWTWILTSDTTSAPNATNDQFLVSASGQITVKTGETYSCALWIKSSRATVLHLQAQWLNSGNGSAGVTSGSDTVVPANTWTRLVVENCVAPANAVQLRTDVDAGVGAAQSLTGDRWDLTMHMIVAGRKITPHYDGLTLGWKWEGTAALSASIGYPPSPNLIRNLVNYPRPVATQWQTGGYGAGGVGSFAVTSNEGIDIGTPAGKLTWTTPATSGGASIICGAVPNNGAAVVPGQVYTASIWGKVNQDNPNMVVIISWLDAAGNILTQGQTALTTLTANTWTRLARINSIAPANAVRAQVGFRCANLTGITAGFTMWADKAMLTEGNTIHDFADGSTPNWRWEGATGASQSVGYPYTLERMVGESPLAVIEANGTGLAQFVNAPDIGAFKGRTIYCGYESPLDTVPANIAPSIASWGPGNSNFALGAMVMRADITVGQTLTTRAKALQRTQYANGSGASGSLAVRSNNAGLSIRTYAIAGWIEDGLTVLGSMDGLQADSIVTSLAGGVPIVPGDGIPEVNNRLILSAVVTNASTIPRYAYFFGNAHTREQRLAVQTWMSNHYGYSLAA